MTNYSAQFQTYLKDKKLSEISIKNYVSDLRHFLTWSAKNNFNDFKPSVFSTYKSYLTDSKTPSKTINRYLSSLRKFGQFLKEEKMLMINPAEDLENIKSIKTGLNQVKRPVLLEEDMLGRFGEMLKKERLSQATIKNYLSDINQFLEFLKNAN